MNFLRFLEGLRTPFLDAFFSAVTHLGEETVFILVGLLFFWCIDKKKGYYILSVGFLGTIFNQFLKLLFRIPRPWVKDPDFTIVESARAEATGYSFPSGHTQSSVGVFGAIGRTAGKWSIRALCIAACVLVPLSRLYLGVHTPLDVGVSIGIALLLVFGLYPLVERSMQSKYGMYPLLISMLLLAIAFLLFVLLFPFPSDIDPHNYESGLKNAYKLIGCTLGILVAYIIDERYLHFETRATPLGQLLKLVLGLIPLLAIKEGLRTPLDFIFGGNLVADGVRYFLLTAVAGGVWPMIFPWLNKITAKKEQRSAK